MDFNKLNKNHSLGVCMDLTNYLQYRDQFRTGDAFQWKTESTVGWLIRALSGGNVNHTSLILKVRGYHELTDRVFLLESLSRGVVFSSASRRISDHKGEVYWLPLKKEFNNKRSSVGSWALQQVGVKYDYKGLIQQIFGRVLADAKLYFCSEYAYFGWKNANIPMNNPSGMAPRPCDIPDLGIHENQVNL